MRRDALEIKPRKTSDGLQAKEKSCQPKSLCAKEVSLRTTSCYPPTCLIQSMCAEEHPYPLPKPLATQLHTTSCPEIPACTDLFRPVTASRRLSTALLKMNPTRNARDEVLDVSGRQSSFSHESLAGGAGVGCGSVSGGGAVIPRRWARL